jgi:hypothetical protein
VRNLTLMRAWSQHKLQLTLVITLTVRKHASVQQFQILTI